MDMDGDVVLVGDTVFDVLFGTGTVTELLVDDRFRVKFPNKNQPMTYSTTGIGVRYSERTLYWHDPVITIPFKSEPKWLALRPVVTDLVNSLRLNRNV